MVHSVEQASMIEQAASIETLLYPLYWLNAHFRLQQAQVS
jgi:hypothetical protein